MKRLLSIILAVVMCVLPLAANVSAAEVVVPDSAQVVYTLSDAAAFPGETIQVVLSVEASANYNSVAVAGFEYNKNALEFTGFSDYEHLSTVLPADKTIDQANMNFMVALSQPVAEGTLCVLNFKIKDNAPIGEVTLNATTLTTKNGSTPLEAFLVPATITVKGKDFTGLSLKDKTVTYDSEEHSLEVTGVPEFATVAYTCEGEEFDGAEDAGTYNVTAIVTAPGYNVWKATKTLKINPKPVTIKAVVSPKDYDGLTDIDLSGVAISVDGYISGDDAAIDAANSWAKYASKNAGTSVAIEYEIKLKGSDVDNYTVTYNVPKATINRKSITVTAEDKTVKVGAGMPDLTYKVEGLVEGDTLVGTITTTAKNTNTVKDYPITPNFTTTKNPNYNFTNVKGTLSVIAKDEQEVTIAAVDAKTYGDDDFQLVVTEGAGTDAAVEFKAGTSNISVNDSGLVSILGVGTGTAKITVSKAGDADYADFTETVTFTVNKKDLVIKADNVTVMKGDAIPTELTYEVEGLVEGDELTGKLATTAKNSNTVKDYPITQGTLKASANYNVSFTEGVLSVVNKTKQDISVNFNEPDAITYGDEGFKIDVTYGDVLSEAPTVFASDNEAVAKVDENGNVTVVGAGKARISVSRAGTATIADFETSILVNVNKKAITIAAKDASKKVGGVDPKLSYTVTGTLVGDDVISGNVSREEGEDVGTYIIGLGTLSITNSANYDVNFLGGTFTIFDKTPQDVSVTPAYTKTYGDEGFKLDVTLGANVTDSAVIYTAETDNISVDSEGNVTIIGAGNGKVLVTKAGNDDYADFSATVKVTVEKKVVKVKANDVEVYVDQTPVLTYTYDEAALVGDDAFEGELYVDNKNVAGKRYIIKLGSLTLGDNYEIDFESGTLLILKKLNQYVVTSCALEAEYGMAGNQILLAEPEKYNSEAEIAYTSSNTNVATVDENGYVTFVGAGKTTITVTVPGNYKFNDYEDSHTLTIRPKPITVTADNLIKKLGTADPELTYKTDVELVEGDEFTGELTRKAGEELGTYAISQGTLALSDNYKLTFVKGTFTIVDKNPQTVTVAGIPETVTYGDASFTITVSSAELADAAVTFEADNADVISVDENGTASVGVAGEAVITVTVAGNDDYAQAVVTKTVVVAAKEVAITTLDAVNKTVVFDAVLEADKEAVSVDFNKLTFAPEAVEEGQTPANYVVTGFVLTGDKAANYVLATESVLVPISEDVALIAVSAVAENGTVEGTGSYLAGSEVTVKATPDKNYKFSGWYIGEEKVASDAEYTFTPDADTELTAKFTKKSTGSVGGGISTSRVVYFEVEGEETTKISVEKGEKVQRPEDPEREGFVFGGWYTDKACTKEYDFDTAVTASITLYSKWTAVETSDDGEDKPDDGEDKPETWENPYVDVDENDWFYDVVKAATQAGIMNGMSDNEFAPDTLVTRAMIVTMLHRAEGSPAAVNEASFEDLVDGFYYVDAVAWAAENGIVNGYSETEFAPDDNVTREQIAAIIFRYAGYKGIEAIELSENLFFDDADEISEYAVAPMNWLVGKEIITGYEDGTVRPQGNATRAEVAAITARILAYLAQ